MRLLLEVTNALVSKRDLRELLAAVSASLKRLLPHRSASFALLDESAEQLVLHAVELESRENSIGEGRALSIEAPRAAERLRRAAPLSSAQRISPGRSP